MRRFWLILLAVCAGACLLPQAPAWAKGVIFDGDGSDEPGFVPLPVKKHAPPPPPANVASGESYIPYPGPPATPLRRSEKKRPPTPPVLIVKLTSTYGHQDWNSRPNDVNQLLKSLKKFADIDFHFDTRAFREVSADPEKNPIQIGRAHV